MRKMTDIPYGKLHKAGEDYLEAILIIQNTKGAVRSVDIAQQLDISRPSVCNAVSVLRQAGHITVDNEHFIHLTEEGRGVAEQIYERHCFFKDLLIHIGVDPAIAEEDACKMEHAVSPETFQCLKDFRPRLEKLK